ncbi:MAG: insulinase family protein [Thermodesulfobacteriota bacterium]
MPSDPNNPGLSEGARILGYRLLRIVSLDEINSIYYELQHAATRCRHVHISNQDAENTFSVAFKTVPADSTGVAHILEHTVLCGSEKFPVRDPFFSMLKRSLSTFMNAFTASDWTMYPFSTQNRNDFYNLMDVYLDAVFRPILDPLNFKQEGHRLEIDASGPAGTDGRLEYKGVVYNEMKGAMSSPDQVMARSLLDALYPETTYRFNSGGDPRIIPRLTYDQLKSFHRRHYHPSNAFFYTYGHLPLRDHLEFIETTILKNYEYLDPHTEVPSQPRWRKPRTATYSYPLGKNEDPARKSQACVAWLVADIKKTEEVLVLTLLEQILLGNAASPLRKALIDSGMGSSLSDGTGFDADNRDTLFAAGLKDIEASAAPQIESIVFDTLKALVKTGIEKELIDTAIHQIEFHRKEITNHPYPYGIKLLLSFGGSWFHGGDPVRTLKFDSDLENIRKAVAAGPFFENSLKKYFLDNPHRVRLTLVPDAEMEEKEKRRVAEELDEIRAGMASDQLKEIAADARSLQQLQEAEMDVSCLPTLALAEIPPDVKSIAEKATDGPKWLSQYPQPTAGIFYLTAAIGAGSLEQDQVPLVPFFCYAFSKIGTSRRGYAEMVRRIDRYTGGVGLSANARTAFDSAGTCRVFLSLNGKSLVRNQDTMFDIIAELAGAFDFGDLTRLKALLLEYRAALEAMVVHNGHRLAISLASRNFSAAEALDEAWHGIHQLKTIKELTADLTDGCLQSVADSLTGIGRSLLTRENIRVALIGEDSSLPAARASVAALHGGLSGGPAAGFGPPAIAISGEVPREGWTTSTAVSFVARTFRTVRMDHEDAPALAVVGKMLRSLYLHREIREKGGAYGGFAIYNPESGLFSFGSYRDPHIAGTLAVYDGAAGFVRSKSFSDEDVKEATLQVCSEIDKPDPPGPAARKAFYRKMTSLTDDARKRFKSGVVSLSRNRVQEVAEKYFHEGVKDQAVAVISGEGQLQAANEKLKDQPLKLYPI